MSSITPPFEITVCGIEELAGHCSANASHVLSILDPDHPVPEAFGAFGEHEKLELRFNDIIEEVPGRLAPGPGHVGQILAFGRGLLAEPPPAAHLLVHCHAGVSRSTASMAGPSQSWGQAATAVGACWSLAAWKRCPKPVPSVPL